MQRVDSSIFAGSWRLLPSLGGHCQSLTHSSRFPAFSLSVSVDVRLTQLLPSLPGSCQDAQSLSAVWRPALISARPPARAGLGLVTAYRVGCRAGLPKKHETLMHYANTDTHTHACTTFSDCDFPPASVHTLQTDVEG